MQILMYRLACSPSLCVMSSKVMCTLLHAKRENLAMRLRIGSRISEYMYQPIFAFVSSFFVCIEDLWHM